MIFGKTLLISAVALVTCQAAHLSKINYKGVLSPELEAPAVEVDTQAYGTFVVTAKFGRKINYEINVHELTSPITGVHFHMGTRGMSGPVVQAIVTEKIDDTEASIVGEFEADDALYQLFLDGIVYINVHTEDVPSGEVRGQLDTVELDVFENKMAGPGTKANGVSTVYVDDGNTVAFEINIHKLESALKSVHFHEGGPGEDGARFYDAPLGDMMNKKQGIVSGSFIATDEQALRIKKGKAYINLHTFKFPDGEMRSDIQKEYYVKFLRG